jgi:hypothetical protein
MLGALQRAPVVVSAFVLFRAAVDVRSTCRQCVDPFGGADSATKSCTDRKTLPVSVRVSKQVLTQEQNNPATNNSASLPRKHAAQLFRSNIFISISR